MNCNAPSQGPRPKYHSIRRYRPDRDIVSLVMYKRRLMNSHPSIAPMLQLRIKNMEKVLQAKRDAVVSGFNQKIAFVSVGLNKKLAKKIQALKDQTSLTIECKKIEIEREKVLYMEAYDQNVAQLMSTLSGDAPSSSSQPLTHSPPPPPYEPVVVLHSPSAPVDLDS